MDQFRVHKMAVVLEELRKCNTDVVYIPAGMTYFLQPCDVFLNKPFKGQIRTLWQKYMTDQYKTNTGKLISSWLIKFLEKFVKPTKETVIGWISISLNRLEFAENAFMDVILRDPEEVKKKVKYDQLENEIDEEEGGDEDTYELIYEDDYDFSSL